MLKGRRKKWRKGPVLSASTLQFLFQLAKGISRQFGPNCEVVVHDLDSNDPNSSIVAIENGHVTGRKVGDGPSHVVLEALRSGRENLTDHLSYLTRTKDGKILKSSTIYVRDDDGEAIGIFAINYDITLMLAMEENLKQFTATDQDQREPERISRNVGDLLDELIEQSVKIVGKPVALMTKEDKVKAIQFLNETGAFLITKSGDKVCRFFGISKYTLYSYIDEAKE
nr:helix-turn-helix transcriptional regulator [Intestinimonas massiliensis (ex Afouda et al. 2020)]